MEMEIVFIIFLIMALFYTFIYFLFIRKYKDLKKLFIINKLYDVFVIIPEIFIGFLGFYDLILFRILLLINFLSILYIVIKVFKNKEPKRKIIYAILSHSEWLIFF